MLEGSAGGRANWAEVKAQAANMLGIQLDDQDILNVPLLATDQYGEFIPHPSTGFAQIVTNAGPPPQLASGTAAAPIDATGAIRTGHAFLDDIAHHAAPGAGRIPDADTDQVVDDNLSNTYDNELLDAHFITGDGRGNENIGLTTVHHVFHAEHNRQVAELKQTILDSGDQAFIDQWHLPDGSWDGERVFQAAKFATEMQYQHLVFEEFARKVQPNVNLFANYQTEIDPSIVAEFAHAVYRFGHSMLNEDVAPINADGSTNDIGLIQAFLNPLEFTDSGPTPEAAAGAIIRGMTRQTGNEIDEFVTEALRNNLVGLPLDLPAINIARGRETGVPTLNAARRDFFDATGDSQLQPYDNWFEFGLGLRHPESIINFVAAYGTHAELNAVDVDTLAEKRAVATALVLGGNAVINAGIAGERTFIAEEADRTAFLNSTGQYVNGANGVTTTGVDTIDFWMGGLAEKQQPFGGLLGSTFNFVFETQMEKLQDGDRFYYLARTAGLNFLTELEGNSFAKLITQNTDVDRLPGDVFSTPAYILEADIARQMGADPAEVIRSGTGADLNLRYTGAEHVVLGGTDGNNILIASEGDDTVSGDGGNDRIEGGAGNDILIGGLGDDIITDSFGDDNIKGEGGNAVISAGAGIDLILAGAGDDFVVAGRDPKETFGGAGNDFIIAGDDSDIVFGGEGDDWIERGNGADLLQGDNGDPFQESTIIGNDVIIGGGGNDDYDSETGDDIMVAGPVIERNEGMLGFDWLTHKGDPQAANADMNFTGLLPPDLDNIRDRFDLVEGLSGWNFSDILRGDDENNAVNGVVGNELTEANIPLINGLQEVLGAGVFTYDSGNIILGGDGGDLIEGRGGDDIIDGDKWLNVRLNATDINGAVISADSMTELQAAAFAGQINPGSISIEREILDLTDEESSTDTDTALFQGVRASYTISAPDLLGKVTVTDNVGTDGTDTVTNIERLQFTDETVVLVDNGNRLPVGQPTIDDTTPDEGQLLTASAAGVTDPDNPGGAITGTVRFVWQQELNPGDGIFTDIEDVPAAGTTFTTGAAQAGLALRVKMNYTDATGTVETVFSAPTGAVGNVNDAPVGVPTISDATPTEGQALTASTAGIIDADGTTGAVFTFQWQRASGLTFVNIAAATAATYTPVQADVGLPVRVVVTFTDDQGTTETVTSAATGTVGDLITGTNGANVLTGTAFDDALVGLGGNDTLNGGLGADVMDGGEGNDTYVVDNTGDIVNEAAGGRTDTVQTTLPSYTLGDNVENLAFTGAGDFAGTGSTRPNVITGGSGADTLNGNEGNDTLNGNDGDDTLNGGGGDDTLRGNNAADTLNGGDGGDTLLGGNGNDTLDGGIGNDTLDGGIGNDRMVGGVGQDTYVVNIVGDTVVENANQGIDLVQSTRATYTLGNNVDNLTFTGIGNFTGNGNGLANTITGGAGNDTLNIAAGNDRIIGGAGNDVLAGGANNDVFVFAFTTSDASGQTILIGSGDDRVQDFDFNPAGGGQDRLDIAGLNITAGNFGASAVITDLGADTLVTFGDDSMPPRRCSRPGQYHPG